MPLYDYVCGACGAESELLVRGATTPVCPKCGSETMERLPSLPAVRSSSTQDVAMRSARRRDAAQAKDRIHEQAKYERNHD
jgi:putative FmdB family regulatory protein